MTFICKSFLKLSPVFFYCPPKKVFPIWGMQLIFRNLKVVESIRPICAVVFHHQIARSSKRTRVLVTFCARVPISKYSLLLWIRVIGKEIVSPLSWPQLKNVRQNSTPIRIGTYRPNKWSEDYFLVSVNLRPITF